MTIEASIRQSELLISIFESVNCTVLHADKVSGILKNMKEAAPDTFKQVIDEVNKNPELTKELESGRANV